jgi:phosphoribosylformylglycinamidine synthase
MVRARVNVFLKQDVMDPQGNAVGSALRQLGHAGVQQVRVGRSFDLVLDGDNNEKTQDAIRNMCESLLANTVIESYEIQVQPQEDRQ